MPTAEPPTPTHEEAREIVNDAEQDGEGNFLEYATTAKLLAYIEQAESTAAELLKARERIAQLEAYENRWAGVEDAIMDLHALVGGAKEGQTVIDAVRKRIAELERENAELRKQLNRELAPDAE